MNATRQLITRRAIAMGPRLTTPARYSSTSAQLSKHDRSLMHSVFTIGSMATVGGVFYAAARSGNRMNTRYSKKNASLDSSKWFLEGADVSKFMESKH